MVRGEPNTDRDMDQSTWIKRLTQRLDDIQVWITAIGLLWTVLSAITSRTTIFGSINWADSIIIGSVFSMIITISITLSLAFYRLFMPLYSTKNEKRSIISGNRGLITSYYRDGRGITFRDHAEHQAVFLYVRRHLRNTFFEKFYSAESDGTDKYFDSTIRLYMDEIDRLADKWKVA